MMKNAAEAVAATIPRAGHADNLPSPAVPGPNSEEMAGSARLGLAAPQVCIACGTPPRASFRLHNGAPLLRCPQCGLGWWPWPPFDPAAFYDRDYFQSADTDKGYSDYASLEGGVRRTARARLARLARLRRGGADVCGATGARLPCLFEIGCGTGLFLDEARAAGWDARGIEVSAYAADIARRRGFDVESIACEQLLLAPASYDCIAMWDVIEHVRDPAGLVRQIGAALRPGGIAALSTGDVTSWCARLTGAKWHLFNLPEHLFFFSPQSLQRLLAAAGCDVRISRYEVNWVPFSYITERLGKVFSRARGNADNATGVGRKSARTDSSWAVPATLFDVLGVYAVRREQA